MVLRDGNVFFAAIGRRACRRPAGRAHLWACLWSRRCRVRICPGNDADDQPVITHLDQYDAFARAERDATDRFRAGLAEALPPETLRAIQAVAAARPTISISANRRLHDRCPTRRPAVRGFRWPWAGKAGNEQGRSKAGFGSGR